MPARRGRHRVPADLGVQMGMDINEPGRHQMPLGINRPLCRSADVPDFGNPVALHGNIGLVRRLTRPVNNGSAFDHNIVGHAFLPALKMPPHYPDVARLLAAGVPPPFFGGV